MNRLHAWAERGIRRARRKWFRFRHAGRASHDIVACRHGVRVSVPSASVLAEPWYVGGFEEAEIRLMLDRARPGDRVMDVGANIGIHSLLLAKAIGVEGHVWGFEPTAGTAERFRANVALNNLGNVTVVEKAVTDHEGDVEFHLFDGLMDVYNSTGAVQRPAEGLKAVRTVQVPAVTLDAFAEQERINRVDFIKVDVEGAEERVLAGARRLLECNPGIRIMAEAYEPSARQCGCSTAGMCAYMVSLGFKAFTVGTDGRLVDGVEIRDGTLNVWFERKL